MPGWPRRSRRRSSWTPRPTPHLPPRAGSTRSPSIRGSSPSCSTRSSPSTPTPITPPAPAPPPARHRGDRSMFGRLTLEALPLYSAIAAGGAAVTIGGALVVAIAITWLGAWRYLWTDWLTSVDHKRIGIMYIVLAL